MGDLKFFTAFSIKKKSILIQYLRIIKLQSISKRNFQPRGNTGLEETVKR